MKGESPERPGLAETLMEPPGLACQPTAYSWSAINCPRPKPHRR